MKQLDSILIIKNDYVSLFISPLKNSDFSEQDNIKINRGLYD